MRKLLAAIAILFGCLVFAGQSVAAATAGYSDCCLNGCKGMAQCASAACQACATPQAAPAAASLHAPAGREMAWQWADAPVRAGPAYEPWSPPD